MIEQTPITPAEFDSFVTSPFRDERVAELDPPILLVRGAQRPLASPMSLPVVVAWIGAELGGQGPKHTDVVIDDGHADHLVAMVARFPLASTSFVVHLRAVENASVEHGLAMESAVYSTLQAGPEFATWRSGTEGLDLRTTDPTVLTSRDDDELTITLDRPDHHNAITAQLRDELHAALAIAVADDTISSVRLVGNGPSFCSGGDLTEFGSRSDPATAHRIRLTHSPARMIHMLRHRLSVEIHGSTLGGGIEMAAFAGHVVADPDVAIALPELALGLIPGAGGTVSITRRCGRQRCAALGLTSAQIDAARALEWGLVDDVRSLERRALPR